jgi:hypothetical protein
MTYINGILRRQRFTGTPFVSQFRSSTTVYANQQTNSGNWSSLGPSSRRHDETRRIISDPACRPR